MLELSYIFLITIFCLAYCEEQHCFIDNRERCVEDRDDNIYKKGIHIDI